MKTVLSHTCAVVLIFMALVALPAAAQSLTPERVYTTTSTDSTGNGNSILNGFTQTSSTGVLSTTAGSPYPERLDGAAMAVDVKGRFLFVANRTNNSISMFQIDSSTGALTEVPASPFASGPPSLGLLAPAGPVALVGEPTGQYLYVGYQTGSATGESAVITYVIDAVHLALIPLPQSEADQSQQSIVAMLVDAHGRNLYVANGMQGGGSFLFGAGIQVYQIGPSNGALTLAETASAGSFGRSMAMDPQNRFIYYGTGQNEGLVYGYALSPVDSLPGPAIARLIVGTGTIDTIAQYPRALAIENTGTFIYVLAPGAIYTYAIDQTSGNLSVAPGSPPLFATLDHLVADPQGPYLYGSQGDGSSTAQVHAYHVNAQTGLLTEVAGSPFVTGTGISRGLVFAGPPQSVQGISGPAPVFDSNQEGFSSLVVGATSGTVMDRLANNGDQPLLISSITLGGTNPGDFHATNNCPVSLSGNVFCTVSLTFTPTAVGSRQALLIVADNGPGGSQSIALSGTGLSGTPAVTLSSGSLTFSTIPALTTSSVQNVTVTNSGTATLHVSNVALSGANPGDFKVTNGCTAAVNIGGNCVIGVTFTPAAAGQRTSQVVIGDDAANSPQTVSLTGNASSPFTVLPSSSNSDTVKAGTPAQFALTVTPANGFSGTAQVQCTGAPQGATCVVPPTLQVTSGSTSPLNVSVTTTAGSTVVPMDDPSGKPQTPITPRLVKVLMLLVLLVIVLAAPGLAGGNPGLPALAGLDRRRAWQHAALALALCAILVASGCGAGVSGTAGSNGSNNGSNNGSGAGSAGGSNGGSSGGTNPASLGTPAGSYTLTVTVTVGSVSVPTQLTLIVN